MSRNAKVATGVVAGLVAVAVVGVGAWWFLRSDAPAAVSLDAATEAVTTTVAPAGGGEPAAEGIEGTWTVDTTTGTFDYDSATGSFVGFRIDEELVGIGGVQAVGRTGDVTGTLDITGDDLAAASFTAEMATITTNDSRRDNATIRALDVGTHPSASFVLGAPVLLGAGAANGDTVTATATGEFTLVGETRPVEVNIEARLVEGTIVVVGSFEIAFADYGVTVPSAPIVVSVADTGTVEFQLLFTRS